MFCQRIEDVINTARVMKIMEKLQPIRLAEYNSLTGVPQLLQEP
jgi:hypothetical protein